MKHGSNCDCGMCAIGKKMGMIKKAEEKTFTCTSCGSTSKDAAGECCSAEREEVKS